jgi:hypothetical protein
MSNYNINGLYFQLDFCSLNPPSHFGHQGTKAQRNTNEFYFKDKKNIIFVPLSVFVSWWQRKSQKVTVALGLGFP